MYKQNSEAPPRSPINKLKALIFLGSVREGRNVVRVSNFIKSKLKEANYEIEVFDPLELDLPLLKQPLQFYQNQVEAPQILHDLNAIIKAVDTYVILTAEYNRQMPPALTNLLDYFPPSSYAYKPSAIVCYSMGTGGITAAAQARTLMTELGAPPIPYILHIPEVTKRLSEEGEPQIDYLQTQAEKMIKQLTWYTTAIRNQRQSVGIPE